MLIYGSKLLDFDFTKVMYYYISNNHKDIYKMKTSSQ